MAFHNLGDTPGETEHGKHGGMELAVHGKRARGGKADEDERERDAAGGKVNTKLARGGKPNFADGGSLSSKGATDRPQKGNMYNAVGSPEMKEAQDETPDFNRGGKAKRKAGGTTEGHMSSRRHDRHARGGAAKSPYSTGASLSPPTDDRAGRGYEGGGPA